MCHKMRRYQLSLYSSLSVVDRKAEKLCFTQPRLSGLSPSPAGARKKKRDPAWELGCHLKRSYGYFEFSAIFAYMIQIRRVVDYSLTKLKKKLNCEDKMLQASKKDESPS